MKHDDSSTTQLAASVAQSLRALRTDRIGLLLRLRDPLLDSAEVAERLGCAPATVAHAWLLRLPCRPHPIVGPMRLQGPQQALAALAQTLGAETWAEIWQAGAGHEVP